MNAITAAVIAILKVTMRCSPAGDHFVGALIWVSLRESGDPSPAVLST
jgi:hypothetical protein